MTLEHSKSKAARERNIKREIAAGKPPEQAVAIGYSVQREAGDSSGRFVVPGESRKVRK